MLHVTRQSWVLSARDAKNEKETCLWKKYSRMFKPILEASELTVVYTKNETPIRAEEVTIAHFRPTRGTPYKSAPVRTPGIPQM